MIKVPEKKWSELQEKKELQRNPYAFQTCDQSKFEELAKKEIERSFKASTDLFLKQHSIAKGSILKIESIKNVMTPEKWARVASFFEKGDYFPLMTWHGTSHPDIVEKIARLGYLQPGELCMETGKVLPMANGAFFGYGVYSSGITHLPLCFGFRDKHGSVQLLVNMVYTGQLAFLKEERCYSHVLPRNAQFVLDRYDHPYDTLATPDMEVVVSANSQNIVPCFVVTLTVGPHQAPKNNVWRYSFCVDDGADEKKNDAPSIKVWKLASGFWLLDRYSGEKKTEKKEMWWWCLGQRCGTQAKSWNN